MAQFSWAAASDVGLGIAGAFSAWGTASANSIISRANADAQNVVRKAQNQERASALTLAGTMRSLQYQTSLRNAGEANNSGAELLARTQESWTRGNFEQGLRDMEALGAYNARAAASGVGGASIQAVSYSMRLQQARVAERQGEKQSEITYELIKQRSGIMPAAVSRLDISPLSPNIDYSVNTASSSAPSLTASLIQGLLTKRESLQTALNSIPQEAPAYAGTGDFARMDRASYSPIVIN